VSGARAFEGDTLATVIGLVTPIVGAMSVVGELQATMNLIWEVSPTPTGGAWAGLWAWLKERVFSLALVFPLLECDTVCHVRQHAPDGIDGREILLGGDQQLRMDILEDIGPLHGASR
jgi:hypothetical protein